MDFGQHDRVLATRNLTGVLCTAAGCWHSPLKDLNFCLKWITVDLLWEDLHGPLTLKTKLSFVCVCHYDECLDSQKIMFQPRRFVKLVQINLLGLYLKLFFIREDLEGVEEGRLEAA